ncbi:hypothetical protein AVEN_253576-1 [Araneus ventricosus]|uniref:Uncharacterized protein n=1 Tax=Araneus ventricosus TaxID=182803 RepID=A0A4Y2RML6_ARAVE|nr:hypothetical protein AVEN_253576-1 [Araneus ventricosus]
MALMSSWINGLTPEMSRIAEKELKETHEKRKEALKEIKRFIKAVVPPGSEIYRKFITRLHNIYKEPPLATSLFPGNIGLPGC